MRRRRRVPKVPFGALPEAPPLLASWRGSPGLPGCNPTARINDTALLRTAGLPDPDPRSRSRVPAARCAPSRPAGPLRGLRPGSRGGFHAPGCCAARRPSGAARWTMVLGDRQPLDASRASSSSPPRAPVDLFYFDPPACSLPLPVFHPFPPAFGNCTCSVTVGAFRAPSLGFLPTPNTWCRFQHQVPHSRPHFRCQPQTVCPDCPHFCAAQYKFTGAYDPPLRYNNSPGH